MLIVVRTKGRVGATATQLRTLKCMNLLKTNHSRIYPEGLTATIKGMLSRVRNLVTWFETDTAISVPYHNNSIKLRHSKKVGPILASEGLIRYSSSVLKNSNGSK